MQEAETELLEQAQNYGAEWTESLDEDNISEDERFRYLEVETSQDISTEFFELGIYLDAKSTAEVDHGDRYVLSVKK